MGLDLTTTDETARNGSHSAHLIELELYYELIEFVEAPDSERINVIARQIEHDEFELGLPSNGETAPEPPIPRVLNEATLAPPNNGTSKELGVNPLLDLSLGPSDKIDKSGVIQTAAEGGKAALPVNGATNGSHSPGSGDPRPSSADEVTAMLKKAVTGGLRPPQPDLPKPPSKSELPRPAQVDFQNLPKVDLPRPPNRTAELVPPSKTEPPIPKPPQPGTGKATCSECGHPYTDADLICIGCGAFVG